MFEDNLLNIAKHVLQGCAIGVVCAYIVLGICLIAKGS